MMERLDVALVARGLLSGRDKAAEHIKKSLVFVNGIAVTKPSTKVDAEDCIEVQKNLIPYVSRGGLKLEHALNSFHISPKGLKCLDVGASTGGFTECLLKRGAETVLAVDTGRDQLAPSLREDPRVEMLERTDVRNLSFAFNGIFELITVDVSFISLKHMLPRLSELINADGTLICLLKPQFEVGKENIGKKGIVRDKTVHKKLVRDFIAMLSVPPLFLKGITVSPIRGGDGNIEYLLYLSKTEGVLPVDGDALVESAFSDQTGGVI